MTRNWNRNLLRACATLGLAAVLSSTAAAQSPANSGSQSAYGAWSLVGTYAVVPTQSRGHTPGAGAFLFTFDGKGEFTLTGTVNASTGQFGERQLLPLADTGFYSVNPDGSGSLMTVTGVKDSFVLRKVEEINGMLIASEFCTTRDELEPNSGALVSGLGKRLPDGAVFTDASIKGTYSLIAQEGGGTLPSVGMAIMQFGGNGIFEGKATFNSPGPTPCERQILTLPTSGTYALQSDGSGSANEFALGVAHVQVTRARTNPNGGVPLAEEFVIFYKDLTPTHGALIAMQATRIGN